MTGAELITAYSDYQIQSDEGTLTHLLATTRAYALSLTRDEDVAQSVMLNVWQSLGTYDSAKGNFAGWVRTITQNERNRYKRLTEVNTMQVDPAMVEVLSEDAQDEWEHKMSDLLRPVLMSGPEPELIDLAINGVAIWEAGRLLGLSENQIRHKIRKLKKFVQENSKLPLPRTIPL